MARTKSKTTQVSSKKILGIDKKFTYKKEVAFREQQEALYLAIQREQGKKRKSVPRTFLTSTTSKHAADGKRKNGIISSEAQRNRRNCNERMPFVVGETILALWKNGVEKDYPNYYPGKIMKINEDGSCVIKYEDGYEDASVSKTCIRKMARTKKMPTVTMVQKQWNALCKKFNVLENNVKMLKANLEKVVKESNQKTQAIKSLRVLNREHIRRIENLERSNAPRDAVFTSKPNNVAKRKKVVHQTRRICEMDTCTNVAVGISKPNNDKMVCQSCHNAAKRRQKPKKAPVKPKVPGKPRCHPGKTAKQFFAKSTIGKRNIKLREDGPAGRFHNDSEKANYLKKIWEKLLTPKEKEAVKEEYQKKKEAFKKRNEAYEAYKAQMFKNTFPRQHFRKTS